MTGHLHSQAWKNAGKGGGGRQAACSTSEQTLSAAGLANAGHLDFSSMIHLVCLQLTAIPRGEARCALCVPPWRTGRTRQCRPEVGVGTCAQEAKERERERERGSVCMRIGPVPSICYPLFLFCVSLLPHPASALPRLWVCGRTYHGFGGLVSYSCFSPKPNQVRRCVSTRAALNTAHNHQPQK